MTEKEFMEKLVNENMKKLINGDIDLIEGPYAAMPERIYRYKKVLLLNRNNILEYDDVNKPLREHGILFGNGTIYGLKDIAMLAKDNSLMVLDEDETAILLTAELYREV